MKAYRLIYALLVLLISSCASVSRGTIEGTRSILVTSTPVGAEVRHRGRLFCITPCKIQLQNWDLKDPIVFSAQGFESVQVKATDGVSGSTFGNILFGGLVGAGIDVINGSAIKNKQSIHIEFEKKLDQ